MGKFDVKIDKSGADFKINMSGVIDEDADFGVHSLSGASKVELHLENIKSINSCGIREWIKWLSTAGAAQFTYHECPKIIVDQINMVQGFLPASGKVVSFFVPYFNEESGEEKNVLFELGKQYNETGLQSPPEVLGSDGKLMEMDVVEAKYFKFLKK